MHNYKYLEIPINNYLKYCNSDKGTYLAPYFLNYLFLHEFICLLRLHNLYYDPY